MLNTQSQVMTVVFKCIRKYFFIKNNKKMYICALLLLRLRTVYRNQHFGSSWTYVKQHILTSLKITRVTRISTSLSSLNYWPPRLFQHW